MTPGGGRAANDKEALFPTMLKMKKVIDARKAAGLRDRDHVMIGGAPADDKFAHEIGADFYSDDAPGGSSHAREYVRGTKAEASGENGGP